MARDYTPQIEEFLANPENSSIQHLYESTTDEFQANIIAKRKDYQGFDEIFNYLFRVLFARDEILGANKSLTRAVVFFMYWNCDIGKTDEVGADHATT